MHSHDLKPKSVAGSFKSINKQPALMSPADSTRLIHRHCQL